MPRRLRPDPLAKAIGERIRQLRLESKLTLEKLAYTSELKSKGYLSDIEKGLARPSIQTLKVIADHLGILLADLVTFPNDGDRQNLIDRTRSLSTLELRKLLKATTPPRTQ